MTRANTLAQDELVDNGLLLEEPMEVVADEYDDDMVMLDEDLAWDI